MPTIEESVATFTERMRVRCVDHLADCLRETADAIAAGNLRAAAAWNDAAKAALEELNTWSRP